MNHDSFSGQLAQANQLRQLGQLQERVTVKDPTVSDTQDAIVAIRKRRETITAELKSMADRKPRLEAEVARIDRILAAAATEEP